MQKYSGDCRSVVGRPVDDPEPAEGEAEGQDELEGAEVALEEQAQNHQHKDLQSIKMLPINQGVKREWARRHH